jgi:hypothetical protein
MSAMKNCTFLLITTRRDSCFKKNTLDDVKISFKEQIDAMFTRLSTEHKIWFHDETR